VKSAPVLCVTLRPSRIAARLLASATIATAAMLALLPGEPWLRGACVVTAGACGIRALRGATASDNKGAIAAVDLAADRRATLTDRSGGRIEATVQAESYVGALVTMLVLRPEGARRSRALAIWPDTMPAGEFRRLRVLLRHGDPGSART
jgi:Membrane-bound toxin component of toxin-antitoxin system